MDPIRIQIVIVLRDTSFPCVKFTSLILRTHIPRKGETVALFNGSQTVYLQVHDVSNPIDLSTHLSQGPVVDCNSSNEPDAIIVLRPSYAPEEAAVYEQLREYFGFVEG